MGEMAAQFVLCLRESCYVMRGKPSALSAARGKWATWTLIRAVSQWGSTRYTYHSGHEIHPAFTDHWLIRATTTVAPNAAGITSIACHNRQDTDSADGVPWRQNPRKSYSPVIHGRCPCERRSPRRRQSKQVISGGFTSMENSSFTADMSMLRSTGVL